MGLFLSSFGNFIIEVISSRLNIFLSTALSKNDNMEILRYFMSSNIIFHYADTRQIYYTIIWIISMHLKITTSMSLRY